MYPLACLTGLLALLALGPRARAEEPGLCWLEGQVVPRIELRLAAPRIEVELAGEAWRGRSLRIRELAEDGARLAAGERVARFAWPERRLGAAIEARVRDRQVRAERELARLETRIKAQEGDLERGRLGLAKAELELKKKSVLGRRDAELVDLAARRAAFEVKALEEGIQAARRVLGAARADHEERLRQARGLWSELEELQGRLELVAPRAGRLVLDQLPGRGQPARIRDRLGAGQPFARLWVDETPVVEFWVPEELAEGLAPGAKLRIESLPPGFELTVGLTALEAIPGQALLRARAAPPRGETRLRIGQAVRVAWRALEPGAPPPAPRSFELIGHLEAVAGQQLYTPEIPGLPELGLESVAPEGQRVEVGDALVAFDRRGVERRERSLEERLQRARARQAWDEARLVVERLSLEEAVQHKAFLEERAALLAIPGVGLQPELALAAARLDHQLAGLEHRLAREALKRFLDQAEVEGAGRRARSESLEESLRETRAFLGRLVVRAPVAGRVHRPPTGPTVRAGEPLIAIHGERPLVAVFCLTADQAGVLLPDAELEVRAGRSAGAVLRGRPRALRLGCGRAGTPEQAPRGLRLEVELLDPGPRVRPGLEVRMSLGAAAP
jgi:multidrug resistance efflux pump